MERTFIAIKPDGVQRGLVGTIIQRLESRGYQLVGLKLVQVSQELAEAHYAEHRERPFFPGLVKFITSGPVVAMVWQGKGVIAAARKLIGKTNPLDAEPGTIRGDFGIDIGRNPQRSAAQRARRATPYWTVLNPSRYPTQGMGWAPIMVSA